MLRPLPPAKALDVLKRKWERHFDKQVSIICCLPSLYSTCPACQMFTLDSLVCLHSALFSISYHASLRSCYNWSKQSGDCASVMQTSGGEDVKVPGSEPITQECPVSPALTSCTPWPIVRHRQLYTSYQYLWLHKTSSTTAWVEPGHLSLYWAVAYLYVKVPCFWSTHCIILFCL